MTSPSSPGHGDKPIEEIARLAEIRINQGSTIWQKWTCLHCGSRQTMDEPNVLYRSGSCQNCGKISVIVICGFMLAAGDAVDLIAQSVKNA